MDTADVTALLSKWRAGDRGALDSLTPIVYDELHQIAASQLRRERNEHTLAPTALVHEAWMKLVRQDEASFASRGHFYALAARIMRNVLTDHARRLNAERRGGGMITVTLTGAVVSSTDAAQDLAALNQGLDRLAEMNPRQAQILEMRYFGGLNLKEISEITGASIATISRDQRAAEAWLGQLLQR